MKILWALQDYNEPFSGGVERTFHNMIRMADGHENHIWPVSMGTRTNLPSNTTRVNSPMGDYTLAIVEGNPRVTNKIDQIKNSTNNIVIKMQHVTGRTI